MIKTKRLAEYAMLAALAMVLSYLETLIPAFFAVPGMKLGLTNLVVLAALYRIGARPAITINFVRILLTSMLFGTAVSLWYSLAGGLLSGAVMIALKQTGKFQPLTVSIAGGVAHNVGQIVVAMLLMQTTAVAWYLLALWVSGIAAGAVIGLLGSWLIERLPKTEGSMA
ncbi:Gx transporter family protein [Butyricicoccus sp.]|uniref:Gx transporter family protein n=1 Tax=Butyricicoccus sp. TaxID=2049021 RepID=UPI0037352C74